MLFSAYGEGEPGSRRKARFALELLLAVLASGAAFGIRLALDPVLGPRQPYTPSFGAIAIAAWFGGWRAGFLTALASYVLAQYFFVEPRHSLQLGLADLYGGASYWLIAIIAVYLAHRAQTALQALHQVVSEKDQFIAILAHELRNPLGAADLAVHALKADTPPIDSRSASVTLLARQIEHMKRLVRDLVEVSRMTHGKMALDLAPTSIQQCVEDAISGNQAAITAKGQALALIGPDRIIEVLADGARVTQIISNLIHNASKYSPTRAHITVTVERTTDAVHVKVEDDGPGIPAERIAHLFERPSPARTRHPSGGLGIGLWLSRQLGQLHGGTVTARTERAQPGSEFCLSLPLRPAHSAGAASPRVESANAS